MIKSLVEYLLNAHVKLKVTLFGDNFASPSFSTAKETIKL
jgi:hypothetical protein